MTAVPKKKLTEAEYLAIERNAKFKSEFYNGEMFPMQGPRELIGMAGATFHHNRIKDNLLYELTGRLRSGPCQALSSDMRVKISATGLQTYPDLLVVCGTPEFESNTQDCMLNPTVIVEVLSDSTESYDRGKKFGHYRQLPSLQEYILIAQDRPHIERYVRQQDGSWLLTIFDNPAGDFSFVSVKATIPLADIFRGVEFPTDPSS